MILSSHDATPGELKTAKQDPKAREQALLKKYKEKGPNPSPKGPLYFGRWKLWGGKPTRKEKLLQKGYIPMPRDEVHEAFKPEDNSAFGSRDTFSDFSVGELQGFTISKGDFFVYFLSSRRTRCNGLSF